MIAVEFQGHVVSAKNMAYTKRTASGGGKRGEITGFSAQSRLRLIEIFNRMDMTKVKVTFLTLTFSQVKSFEECKKALNRFLMRVRRKHVGCSGVWRMELQRRNAVHFHLLLFGLPFWEQRDLQQTWEACTKEARSIVDIRAVRNHRQLLSYVAKYIGKKVGKEELASLDKDAYPNGVPQDKTGRWWGWLNKANLPMARKFEAVCLDPEMFRYFSWTARKMSGGRCGRSGASIKLFTDQAEDIFLTFRLNSGVTWREYGILKRVFGGGKRGAIALQRAFFRAANGFIRNTLIGVLSPVGRERSEGAQLDRIPQSVIMKKNAALKRTVFTWRK